MGCVAVPTPTTPSLPAGISISPPTLPAVSTPGLCCQFVPSFTFTPPVPLGPLVANPAVLVALNATLQAIQGFLNGLTPSCPRSA